MKNELKYGSALEKAGFKLEKLGDDLLTFDCSLYALSHGENNLGIYFEVYGAYTIPVVDADFRWEVAHGNSDLLALLAVVLPEKTLAIYCSDYSCYFRRDDEYITKWEYSRRFSRNTNWKEDSLRATVLNTIANT